MEASLIGQKKVAPNDARQVRSRNALCGALLELLQETSFDQLTIREITARAGTGYATFFRHYPTKEALLGDVASEEVTDLVAKTRRMLTGDDRFNSAVMLCDYIDRHRALWTALLTGGAAGIMREEILRQARHLAEKDPHYPDWLPPDLAVVFSTSAALELMTWWLMQGDDYPSEKIATILDKLVFRPLTDGRSVSPDNG
ncbi:MAG: TetR/AcrR family transcriptional regulator [Sphingomonadaceae bacterium]|nr:TetR/AcrR family transcriptional regulator [Sphingomonadaceae bacterium]